MKKQVYQMPMVEVMNARVEKGFAGSNGGTTGGNTGWGGNWVRPQSAELHTEVADLAIEDCID
ncbi:MAG: hypothetical protein MJZ67_03695 [Bacteroidales bacterium]|nr:hypothetical protein [Bacteroidales bacterium]